MKKTLTVIHYKDGTEEAKLGEPEYISDKTISLLDIHAKMEAQRKIIVKNKLLSTLEWILK